MADLCVLNHLCDPGVKPTWSCLCVVGFGFADILLRGSLGYPSNILACNFFFFFLSVVWFWVSRWWWPGWFWDHSFLFQSLEELKDQYKFFVCLFEFIVKASGPRLCLRWFCFVCWLQSLFHFSWSVCSNSYFFDSVLVGYMLLRIMWPSFCLLESSCYFSVLFLLFLLGELLELVDLSFKIWALGFTKFPPNLCFTYFLLSLTLGL